MRGASSPSHRLKRLEEEETTKKVEAAEAFFMRSEIFGATPLSCTSNCRQCYRKGVTVQVGSTHQPPAAVLKSEKEAQKTNCMYQ